MEAKAIARYVRFGPRKVMRFTDLIRGKSVDEAKAVLAVMSSPAAKALDKVIDSAVANAENNHNMDTEGLSISRATVDGSLKMPRLRPRARGRADRYIKRTCHITVVVSDGE
jgi:large subunit ribosomal protein L22